MAAQREAVQAVDHVGAVMALGGERQALADAAKARRHLGGIEGRLLVEEGLELVPFARMRGFEGHLFHLRPLIAVLLSSSQFPECGLWRPRAPHAPPAASATRPAPRSARA